MCSLTTVPYLLIINSGVGRPSRSTSETLERFSRVPEGLKTMNAVQEPPVLRRTVG